MPCVWVHSCDPGLHYTNLSLSSTLLLSFSGMCFVLFSPCLVVLVLFLFCFVLMLSLELCICSSDLFLSSRPRTTGLTTIL